MSTERTTDDVHQSITEIVLQRLREKPPAPTDGEVLERASGRFGGNISAAEAVEAVRAERDSR